MRLAQRRAAETLERQGTRLMRGVEATLAEAGVTATVTGFPQIFHVGFGLAEPPRNYRDILATDRAGYVRLTTRLLERGVRALELRISLGLDGVRALRNGTGNTSGIVFRPSSRA